MAPQIIGGATAACSFGAAPASVIVLPTHQCLAGSPAGNVTDQIPIVNVCPFGGCSSLANPAVAAATAAALGVLTPMPCVPVPVGPWLPGVAKALLKGAPALDQISKLLCAWAGVIQIVNAGQVKVIHG